MTVEEIKRAIALIDEVDRLQSKGIIDVEEIASHQEMCDICYDLHVLLKNELERVNGANTIDFDKEVANGVSVSHLHDWYIHSVDNKEPVWTEKHIEELIGDFVLIPRENISNDLQKQIPKEGKWKPNCCYEPDYYTCSVCDNDFTLIDGSPKDNGYNFCPSCGAKLKGD